MDKKLITVTGAKQTVNNILPPLFPPLFFFPERPPLSWPVRVQIALDSARGLEYIHEHTVPVYIHRDIKSANILIDKNFHGKVVTMFFSTLFKG